MQFGLKICYLKLLRTVLHVGCACGLRGRRQVAHIICHSRGSDAFTFSRLMVVRQVELLCLCEMHADGGRIGHVVQQVPHHDVQTLDQVQLHVGVREGARPPAASATSICGVCFSRKS